MIGPLLKGERVLLRPPRPGDERLRQQHGWHAEIERNYGREDHDRPMTAGEADQWMTMVSDDARSPHNCPWVIEAEGIVAGFAQLHGIREHEGRARFAIGMFSPTFIGRGFGAEATRLILRHALLDMGLHRVDLRVLEFNHTARRSYERCGFVIEGRERETCRIGGIWFDDVVMGILAQEFERHTG